MSEHDLRQTFHQALRPFGVVQPVESPSESGIPDECCLLSLRPGSEFQRAVTSWVELKHEHEWPKRSGTPLRLKKFTAEQRLWLQSWARAGGRCCLVAQVATDYLLVPPDRLQALYDRELTRRDLEDGAAAVFGRNAFPTKRMLRWLTG